MKQIIYYTAFLFNCACLTAQIYPIEENGKWGCIDQTGKIIVSPEYESIEKTDVFFRVMKQGKYALMDSTGKLILRDWPVFELVRMYPGWILIRGTELATWGKNQIAFRYVHGELQRLPYEWFELFQFGIARAKIDGRYTFVDTSGKRLTDSLLDAADPFTGVWARIEFRKQKGFFYKDGRLLLNVNEVFEDFTSSGLALVRTSAGYGFIDSSFQFAIAPQFSNARGFRSGAACVKFNGHWGLMDRSGKFLAEPKFNLLGSRGEGLFAYQIGKKFGLMDSVGKAITDTLFDEISPFTESAAKVCIGKKYGAIDTRGQWLVPPQYDDVNFRIKDFISVQSGRKQGLYSKRGVLIADTLYDDIIFDSRQKVFQLVLAKKKIGLMDVDGRKILEPEYDNLSGFIYGLARVVLNGKCGVLDSTGKWLAPIQYDDITFNREEWINFKTGDRQGLMNRTGEIIIPALYDYFVFTANDLIIAVTNEEHYGLFSPGGMALLDTVYDFIDNFKSGIAWVRQKNLWGLIDSSASWIVTPQFDKTWAFENGLAWFRKDHDSYGVIDRSGTIVLQPKKYFETLQDVAGPTAIGGKNCQYINDYDSGYMRCSWGLLNTRGEWILKPIYQSIEVGKFETGLAKVRFDEKWGYIDKYGKLVWYQK
ncbi:WG repeat-containing protein [bacterium]|nr:WG repeat-containing protein [bacterium]